MERAKKIALPLVFSMFGMCITLLNNKALHRSYYTGGACEVVPFRYHSIALACHGVAKRRRVKLPPVGGRMCFFLQRT